METNDNTLASEVLHLIKIESKRRFVLLIICIVLLFASNIAWLIAWNIPIDDVSETYELQGEDEANVVYNSQGEVKINGENQSYENTQDTAGETP